MKIPRMSRNTFGDVGTTFAALFFYILCLRLFNNGLGPDVNPYLPIGLSLLVTGIASGLCWLTIVLLRRGRKS